MAMNLYKMIDTSDLLDKAFDTPTMRIKPRSKKRPTLEQATRAVVMEVEEAAVEKIATDVLAVLRDAYDTHVMVFGEHSDCLDDDEREAWEDAADEMVEEVIMPWQGMLSQNWLGENTIASSLHSADKDGNNIGVVTYAYSLGREYWKQLTYDKETGKAIAATKILSSAGLVESDIEARLAIHNNPTEEEKQIMSNKQENDLGQVVAKICNHVGKDYDVMAVYDDLDLASDDDDILAAGAAPRLGLDASDIEVLQIERSVHGSDTMDVVQHHMEGFFEGNKPAKKKKATKAAPKKAKAETPDAVEAPTKAPKKVKEQPNAAELVEPTVLSALKSCGAIDSDMAKGVGVSRGTYNNYVNGKTDFKPTEEQHGFLRGVMVDKLNQLHEALAAMDGNEAEVVF